MKNLTSRLNARGVGLCLGIAALLAGFVSLLSVSRVPDFVTLLLIGVLTAVSFFMNRPDPAGPAASEEPIGWRHDDRELLGFIERVLKGCAHQRVSGITIPLASPFFVVFGVDIISLPAEEPSSVEYAAHCEMHVCNSLAKTFSRHNFWPMNIDGTLICVVNLVQSPEHPADFVENTLVPMLKQTSDQLHAQGISIRIATSGLTAGIENLSTAYQDALDIFSELLMCAPDQNVQIFVADPKAGLVNKGQVVRGQRERLFYNYISTGSISEAKTLLLQMCSEENTRNTFTVGLKRLVENRLEWVLDLLCGLLDSSQEETLRRQAQALTGTAYYDDLVRQLEDWFVLLETCINPKASGDLIQRVLAYICENCCDSQLSVGGISEHFGLNASSLSSSFHSETGIKLIDFIHQQRIRKVKQLLTESRLTLAQIAECTGYYSTLSMSRAFKRYEGITPSKYRSGYL